MKKFCLTVLCGLLCAACTSRVGEDTHEVEADSVAIKELQGIWLDDVSELPLFKIKGDSIYYASQVNVPMSFTVVGDTLMVFSVDTLRYPIESRGKYFLKYRSLTGDEVSLHKAESDTISFGIPLEKPEEVSEVTEKDSVIMYGGERFRGYAYINPTKKKVVCLGLSEEGLPVENVYFDNIIHICIYRGKECLFSRDIKKEMFSGVVPADFLRSAILSDMDFVDVDEMGYWYLATICEPDGASCYNVKLNVKLDGQIQYIVR